MTFKRKYIDITRELGAQLQIAAATAGVSQRKYIEDAIAARIAQESQAAKPKQKGKAKK